MHQEITNNTRTIAVVGLGYVGLPLALLAHKKGYRVVGIDVDVKKVDQLQNSPLEATTVFDTVRDASVIVICVPTPVHEDHTPNLEPVENACKSVGKFLSKGQLIVLESTVNPGVCESIVIPILEKESGLKCGKDFYLAHCPERINPGDKKWNVENINRVVGGFDETSLQKAVEFYTSIISGEIRPMASLKEAEAVKIVENSFRDVNIAFVNELAMSFSRLSIDIVRVIDGAATKPFGFMAFYPGAGVGGHCIPVDPYYLIDYAKQNGFNHEFLSLARSINNGMPAFAVKLAVQGLREAGKEIQGAKVAVLGLAYKPDISDCRESPSFEIIKQLKKQEADVISFDPLVLDKSSVQTLDEAVGGADAVILATCHEAFKELGPEFFLKNGVTVVIDGRNCLSKEKFIASGIVYKGIGR